MAFISRCPKLKSAISKPFVTNLHVRGRGRNAEVRGKTEIKPYTVVCTHNTTQTGLTGGRLAAEQKNFNDVCFGLIWTNLD